MTKIGRREFIGSALVGATALLSVPRSARAADAAIEVLVNEPIARIDPNLYGHFVEHLGTVVYDGIWVGENSKIPNIGGIRKEIVDALRVIKAPIFRYPGGCFADSYDWRDGIGDRSRRPRRTNFWNGAASDKVPANSTSRFEPNHFGTNEFIHFCRLVGGKPYLAANLRGLTAQDFYSWVEYCNSPSASTTLAELRASGSAASSEPFGVEFWGIGNESWGCGGNLAPEEYSQEFRRFTASVPGYRVPLKFIGAGASSDDLNWTRGFFEKTREKGEGAFRSIYGWGIHHYSWNVAGGRTNDWDAAKGDAVKFDNEQFFELMRQASDLESWIDKHWTIMGEYDREHHVKIAVDEWGSWHRPGTEIAPEHILGQQTTMRDALVAALTLDIFNRNANRIMMGNIAQLVNCLHSLFLASGDKFLRTPTYHVFEMFLPHAGSTAVRTLFSAPRAAYQRNGKSADLWGLNGSASINGKQLTLTVTNTHLDRPIEAEIAIRGAAVSGATARVLAESDIHAHNTFDAPNRVVSRGQTVRLSGDRLIATFAPGSVTSIIAALR